MLRLLQRMTAPAQALTPEGLTGYCPDMEKPMLFELTHQQARRLATSTASRIYDMDATRPKNWHITPTECNLTRSDQQYREELEDAYNAIMKQLSGR